MWHEERLREELFAKLVEIDEKIAAEVAAAGCQHCGGQLHRGDYERKPRGGLIAETGEAFTRRCSLCCGREGCRKRALPPSVRFLGRRVYLEAVVLIASVRAMLATAMGMAGADTGVPVRTLRRWRSWWTEAFPKLGAWAVTRAMFPPPPPDEATLPMSLLDRVSASLVGAVDASGVLQVVARLLAPVTTQSVPDGSRFVIAALGH